MFDLTRTVLVGLTATAVFAAGPALAQDATASDSEQRPAETIEASEAGIQWSNPPRIADIEDESDRIEALSVLIGQSHYSRMPEAETGTEETASDAQDTATADFAEEMARHMGTADADTPQAQVHNIEDMFDGAVAEGLQQSAKANAAQIGSLQEVIETEDSLLTPLEENDFGPEDVVAAQLNPDGTIDLWIIPDWAEN